MCVFSSLYLYRQVPILVFALVDVAEVQLRGDGLSQRLGGLEVVG